MQLVAYFTQATVEDLRSIDDIRELACLAVPPGTYKSARSAKGRPRDERYFDRQYAPYVYGGQQDDASFPPAHHLPVWQEPMYHRDDTRRSGGVTHLRQTSPQTTSQHPSLAPLVYLQNIAQPRRHPLDEKALMSFHPGLA